MSSNDATNALGDYDGDEKWDLVIARRNPAQHPYIDWHILNSRDNTITSVRFGINTDQVMPQDYDGDGKTDIAVWRPGNEVLNRPAYFYILQSRDGFRAVQWGSWTDDAKGIYRQQAE